MAKAQAKVQTKSKMDEDAELAALLSGEMSMEEANAEELAALDEGLEDVVDSIEIEDEVAEAQLKDAAAPDPVPEADGAKKRARKSTAGMKPSAVLRERFGDKLMALMTFSTGEAGFGKKKMSELVEERLVAIDKLPKKVGEKAVNLVSFVAGDATVSVYTRIAVELLVAKSGITTADLRVEYGRTYSSGTSNAQSSQMFALLPFFKIANLEGKSLTINDESTLAAMFRS